MDRFRIIPITLFALGTIALAWGFTSEKFQRAASTFLLQFERSPFASYWPQFSKGPNKHCP